jgi:hypothetical protein
VCGIDFPTGTGGAEPALSGVGADGAAERESAERRPDTIAARLEGALDEELSIVPARERDGDREALDPEPEPGDTLATAASGGAHGLGSTAPRLTPGRERGPPDGGNAPGADLTVAPARQTSLARARRGDEEGRARPSRRRSKSGSLVVTTLVAIVLMVSAAGVAWYADLRGHVDLGIARTPLPVALSLPDVNMAVSAEEGWVEVPASSGTVEVTANGPFRVRLDGAVYTLPGGRILKVPMATETELAVRAVRPPTVARVSGAP